MDTREFLNFLVSMLAILNPASSFAVFLSMTMDKTIPEKKHVALITTLSIGIVLLVIGWIGLPILRLFGISLPAFEITGGIIILIRGLSMLHSKETPTSETAAALQQGRTRESIAVVPLAIPIIAGPGAMTTVVIYTQHYIHLLDRLVISLGIVIVTLLMGSTLYFAHLINRIVGETGIKVTTRIMGLILAAIAMSMITTGIKDMFPGLS